MLTAICQIEDHSMVYVASPSGQQVQYRGNEELHSML